MITCHIQSFCELTSGVFAEPGDSKTRSVLHCTRVFLWRLGEVSTGKIGHLTADRELDTAGRALLHHGRASSHGALNHHLAFDSQPGGWRAIGAALQIIVSVPELSLNFGDGLAGQAAAVMV